jgi:hypothetical protein
MKIDRNKMIAGRRAIEIRDALRPLKEKDFTSRLLGTRLTKALLEEGLIECAPNALSQPIPGPAGRDRTKRYQLSSEGHRLTRACFIPRLDRAKADKIVKEFLDRVDEINADDYYLNEVRRVLLFGSYITDATDIGDIDVAMETARKEIYSWEEYLAQCLARSEFVASCRTYIEQLGYGELEVKRFLKARNPYLQFNYIGEVERRGWASRQVRPIVHVD